MFTGLIETTGVIAAVEPKGGDRRYVVHSAGFDWAQMQLGDSIAVNGCCLTAVQYTKQGFAADVSAESLTCTTLGALSVGSPVNLERALLPTTRLGGHLVSGHVDGVGELIALEEDARSLRLTYRAPLDLAKYIARKGSICIDGVSLTVNEVNADTFGVNIIPHTKHETIIASYKVATKVNLEVDVIARYLERMLQPDTAQPTSSLVDLLQDRGFMSHDSGQ